MKFQIVTPYRVSLLQRYGVTVHGNVTSVYTPLPVIRQRRHEAGHAPPPTAKFSNTWRITSSPQKVFMARRLIKAHGQIYLHFRPM